MSWIDLLWPMVTGACLTLALINLRLGLAGTRRAAHLFFALNAVCVAFFSWVELAEMHAASPVHHATVLFYADLATWPLLVSLIGFIWVFFGTGTKWLAVAGPGLYAVGLLSYPIRGVSPAYLEITGLRTMETFGGATYRIAVGTPNPWNVVNYAAVLLALHISANGLHRGAALPSAIAPLETQARFVCFNSSVGIDFVGRRYSLGSSKNVNLQPCLLCAKTTTMLGLSLFAIPCAAQVATRIPTARIAFSSAVSGQAAAEDRRVRRECITNRKRALDRTQSVKSGLFPCVLTPSISIWAWL